MTRLCPSAPAQAPGARVFGVVKQAAGTRRVAYLTLPVAYDEGLEAQLAPLQPNEVLRTTAPCAEGACQHFDGHDCGLAKRIAASLDPAVERPPPCAIRRACRWWHQEGIAACLRCPAVLTASQSEDERFRDAADPLSPAQVPFSPV